MMEVGRRAIQPFLPNALIAKLEARNRCGLRRASVARSLRSRRKESATPLPHHALEAYMRSGRINRSWGWPSVPAVWAEKMEVLVCVCHAAGQALVPDDRGAGFASIPFCSQLLKLLTFASREVGHLRRVLVQIEDLPISASPRPIAEIQFPIPLSHCHAPKQLVADRLAISMKIRFHALKSGRHGGPLDGCHRSCAIRHRWRYAGRIEKRRGDVLVPHLTTFTHAMAMALGRSCQPVTGGDFTQ
jgi:hypothetical protein